MSADTFPMLIIELARVRSDPSRLLATAVLDAIGVMFLQIRHSPVNTVEIAWLVRHAHTLVTFAQDVIGVGWEHEVPEAAAVLRTVLTLSVGSPRDVSDAYPATVCLGSSKVQRAV